MRWRGSVGGAVVRRRRGRRRANRERWSQNGDERGTPERWGGKCGSEGGERSSREGRSVGEVWAGVVREWGRGCWGVRWRRALERGEGNRNRRWLRVRGRWASGGSREGGERECRPGRKEAAGTGGDGGEELGRVGARCS